MLVSLDNQKSSLPPTQVISRWIVEGVLTLTEKEAEVFLEYYVLPQLAENKLTPEDVKVLTNSYSSIGYNFNLLSRVANVVSCI
jgi:hypothetical protein